MALATNTTDGDIALAGDLNGAISSPSLTTTGVVPGTYTNARFVVDVKGRIIYAESMTNLEVDSELDLALSNPIPYQDATDVSKGYVAVDNSNGLVMHDGVLRFDANNVEDATEVYKSVVRVDVSNGLIISGGVLNFDVEFLDFASPTLSGVLSVDTSAGLSIINGALGIQLTPYQDATDSQKGVVRVDTTNLTIVSGVIGKNSSVFDDATDVVKGIVSVDTSTGLILNSGVVDVVDDYLADSTTSVKGVVQIDIASGLTINTGVLAFNSPDATTLQKGLIKIDTTTQLTINSGVLGVDIATEDDFGVIGTSDDYLISIVDGEIDVGARVAKLDSPNGWSTPTTLVDDLNTVRLGYKLLALETTIISVINTPMILLETPSFPDTILDGAIHTIKVESDGLLRIEGSIYTANNTIASLSGVNLIILQQLGTQIKVSLITDFPT